MKTKILPLVMMALAVTAFAGCERHSEDNTPATTNAPSDQPMPGATASNNVIAPPSATWNETNIPASPNWPGTNNPAATNQ